MPAGLLAYVISEIATQAKIWESGIESHHFLLKYFCWIVQRKGQGQCNRLNEESGGGHKQMGQENVLAWWESLFGLRN